jgi:hypothetical protein
MEVAKETRQSKDNRELVCIFSCCPGHVIFFKKQPGHVWNNVLLKDTAETGTWYLNATEKRLKVRAGAGYEMFLLK